MDTMGGTLLRWSRQRFGNLIMTALIVCLFLVAASSAIPVHAATLTVTSLRKAISDAKAGDVITFQAGRTGTLAISESTISGNDAGDSVGGMGPASPRL